MDKHYLSNNPHLHCSLSHLLLYSPPSPPPFFECLSFFSRPSSSFSSWVGGLHQSPSITYHLTLPPSVVKVLTLLFQHMIIPIILITSLILFGHNINFTAFSILYST